MRIVQGRQTQGYANNRARNTVTNQDVNRKGAASQARVVKCYNYQEEDNGDTIIPTSSISRNPNSSKFQSNDIDVFDSDCDYVPSAKVVLMANLSSYDSYVLSEVPFHDINIENDTSYQNVQETQCSEQPSVDNDTEVDITSDSNKKYFEIEKKELSLDNDRRLKHIICQDVMNIVMHANDHSNNVLHANNNSLEHDNSALELLKHENDHLIELLISQDLELLVYVNAICPSLKPVSNKLVVVTPINMARKVRFAESRVSGFKEASGSKPRSNIKKDRISQTLSSNKKTNKVEERPRIAKSSLNNTNRVSKTVCNANVMHYVLNANSELICATCHECMFDAIHDLCVSNYLNDVNARVKSKSLKSRSAKSKKKKMRKPTARECDNLTSYYVEGIGHNLFSMGQFCDSDLEVAFQKHTCYVRNLDSAYLLFGSRDTNLYTISLDGMLKSSPICLLSKASKTKSWLWHRRLSYLNFGTLIQLAKQGLVRGLPKLKFKKDHLFSACSLEKSKKSSYKPKADDTNQEKLYLLHMDLCGPMRVESINGEKYILVIVDDYSRVTTRASVNDLWYTQFTKVIIHYFMSQHKSISRRQGLPYHTVNNDGVLDRLKFINKGDVYQVYGKPILDTLITNEIKISEAYKTFFGISNGLIPPKKGRGKGAHETKATVVSKKTTATSKKKQSKRKLVLHDKSDEAEGEPKNRPTGRKNRTPRVVVIQEPPSFPVKKTQESSGKRKGIELLSDSAYEGAGLRPEVPARTSPKVSDESKDKSKGGSSKMIIAYRRAEEGNNTKELMKQKGEIMNKAKRRAKKGDECKLEMNNLFINSPNASLIDTIPENAKAEINSLLEIQIQQDVPNISLDRNAIFLLSKFLKMSLKLKQSDLSFQIILDSVRSQVPSVAEDYLGSSLPDALKKVLQSHIEKLKKELSEKRDYKDVIEESIQANVINEVKNFLPKFLPQAVKEALEKTPPSLGQSSFQGQSAIQAAESLSEYELKKNTL
ncbi:retrovirus-related pol polyprotein from transposon TNT 1-94 [Tanacetum coccineum]